MTTALAIPAAPAGATMNDPDFAALPETERARVLRWIALLDGIRPPGIGAQITAVTREMGGRFITARRRLSAWQATRDWRALCDGRVLRAATEPRTKDPGFRAFVAQLMEENQRSSRAARRALVRLWMAKKPVPGYEDFPNWPTVPPGWGESNIARMSPPKSDLLIMRRGLKAGAKHLPQLLRTRVGLWPGSHIQMDDVWHDHFVRFGAEACRVLEFGALDVWSGCRYAWGTKPRRKKAGGGGHEGLTEKDFRFFAASALWNHGYSPRGTVLMLERGTAALREAVAQYLHDATRGLITVATGAMHGDTQALLGDWAGRAGGSGNFKSHLESLHSLIHNDLAALPGQTGKDRQSQRESTYGLVRYQEQLLAWAQALPPDLAAGLRHPLLDYHAEFLPFLAHVYAVAINGRTGHDLEGWEELGRVVTRYTLAPGSGLWLDLDDIPAETRALVTSAAAADPARWTRRHRMSPAEVWQSGRGEMIRPSLAMIIDMLGPDCAVERKVEGSYIAFQDREVSPSPLIYEARITTPDGQEKELRRGETYQCFAFPYDPSFLALCDGKGRCLGSARRVKRVSLADKEGMIEAWGRNAHRTAELLENVRGRHAETEAADIALRRHNAELGFPGAPGRNGGRKEAKAAAGRRETQAAALVTDILAAEAGDDWMEDGPASPYR